MRSLVLSLSLSLLASATAVAQQTPSRSANAAAQQVTVDMKNTQGQSVGTVEVRQLANGTLFVAELENLPPGPHGFHIHEVGSCEAPDFKSAGGHFNPTGAAHGFDSAAGPHAGDLPNIHVADDGTATAEFFSTRLSLSAQQVAGSGSAATGAGTGAADAGQAGERAAMLDSDGSAIIVHAEADDHADMDSAAARIACGVIGARAR